MRVTMVMVSSLNGKITKGNNSDVTAFSSKEDQELFAKHKNDARVIIMGSKTYDIACAKMKLSSKTLRIVMSRNPQKYVNVPGKLEFTDEMPQALVKRLEKKGFREVLLAGGGIINSLFLEAGLVDEIYITIEPQIFGGGKDLVASGQFDAKLLLTSQQQLNKNGTLLLKYKVMK